MNLNAISTPAAPKKAIFAAFFVLIVSAGTALGDDSFVSKYRAAVAEARAKWLTERPIGESYSDRKIASGTRQEVKNGERINTIETADFESAAVIDKLVLADNSSGLVFPGAILWSEPLTKGKIETLGDLGGTEKIGVAIVDATTDGDRAGSEENDGNLTFEFNGTLNDYTNQLNRVLGNIANRAPRVKFNFETGRSLSSAMLQMGLSAKGWGAQLDVSRESNSTRQQSFALITLDELYYTAATDTVAMGELPPLVEMGKNAYVANTTLALIPHLGEPVYVRTVGYGRRVMIALRSEASVKEMEDAVHASYEGFGAGVGAGYEKRLKEVMAGFKANAVVIGGRDDANNELVETVLAGPADFLKQANTYLKKSSGFKGAVGVPISFSASYPSDLKPFQSYETAKFAGVIPIDSSWGVGVREASEQAIEMGPENAELMKSDWEVDHDDNTEVKVSYSVKQSNDKKSVVLTAKVRVREMERGGNYKKGHTVIESKGNFVLYQVPSDDPRTIASFDLSNSGSKTKLYTKKRDEKNEDYHGLQNFPAFSGLTNIKVSFDGSGDDRKHQRFIATVSAFKVTLAAEKGDK